MGLWSWLFGNKAPELEEDGNRLIDATYRDGKRHGPYKRYRKDGSLLEEGNYTDGEKDGPFVIHGRDVRIEGTYRAGKLHGTHRALNRDGTVKEEREYDNGEVIRGPHEQRDDVHRDWVRERGTIANGKRDGVWREYGIPNRSGRTPLLKRCHYKDGVLHGTYETWFYDGTRDVEGEYRDDKRIGRWTYYRGIDGSTQAELDYDDGAITRWRWLARDGSERPLVEVTDPDDLERWLVLADAWDDARERGGVYGIESAIDRWPDDQRVRPLAWLEERILSEGRPAQWDGWIELMVESDVIDPRTRFVDCIELDHHEWDEAQTRRLQRFAPQILTVSLVECVAHPDITALFDVPWPKLTSLYLHECGAVDELPRKLVASPIEHLALTYVPLNPTAVHAIANAPWFDTLQSLQLTVEQRDILDIIAKRAMPELRELEIECEGLALTADERAILFDREQRPTLERVTINGEVYSAISTK